MYACSFPNSVSWTDSPTPKTTTTTADEADMHAEWNMFTGRPLCCGTDWVCVMQATAISYRSMSTWIHPIMACVPSSSPDEKTLTYPPDGDKKVHQQCWCWLSIKSPASRPAKKWGMDAYACTQMDVCTLLLWFCDAFHRDDHHIMMMCCRGEAGWDILTEQKALPWSFEWKSIYGVVWSEAMVNHGEMSHHPKWDRRPMILVFLIDRYNGTVPLYIYIYISLCLIWWHNVGIIPTSMIVLIYK